jgi:hypothetical protein
MSGRQGIPKTLTMITGAWIPFFVLFLYLLEVSAPGNVADEVARRTLEALMGAVSEQLILWRKSFEQSVANALEAMETEAEVEVAKLVSIAGGAAGKNWADDFNGDTVELLQWAKANVDLAPEIPGPPAILEKHRTLVSQSLDRLRAMLEGAQKTLGNTEFAPARVEELLSRMEKAIFKVDITSAEINIMKALLSTSGTKGRHIAKYLAALEVKIARDPNDAIHPKLLELSDHLLPKAAAPVAPGTQSSSSVGPSVVVSGRGRGRGNATAAKSATAAKKAPK